MLFQSTHPHRVRRRGTRFSVRKFVCFNPRTHTGCDLDLIIDVRQKSLVSIHAPTQGATYFGSPPRLLPICFNPRTHTGCDTVLQNSLNSISKVSIHAPTQGATKYLLNNFTQSRFQSTHPHRVRLYIQQMSEYQLNKVSILRS